MVKLKKKAGVAKRVRRQHTGVPKIAAPLSETQYLCAGGTHFKKRGVGVRWVSPGSFLMPPPWVNEAQH